VTLSDVQTAMDTATFRRTVDALAQRNGFARVKSVWFRVGAETIIGLDLQRSGYGGRRYYLNLKVWIQGINNRTYTIAELSHRDSGHVFRREPPEYSDVLDLESSLDDAPREAKLEELFRTFVRPAADALATCDGIWRSAHRSPALVFLLPSVREHLQHVASAV
jgi:hypothetical protein